MRCEMLCKVACLNIHNESNVVSQEEALKLIELAVRQASRILDPKESCEVNLTIMNYCEMYQGQVHIEDELVMKVLSAVKAGLDKVDENTQKYYENSCAVLKQKFESVSA